MRACQDPRIVRNPVGVAEDRVILGEVRVIAHIDHLNEEGNALPSVAPVPVPAQPQIELTHPSTLKRVPAEYARPAYQGVAFPEYV